MTDTNIKILADREDIVAVADAVRAKTGTTAALTLGDMVTAIEDINIGSDPVLQDKTVTPTTSKQTITADSGYDGLSQVTVNAMPTATQATPSISVNSSGLITASATQTAGYVAAGTKSATKQLTTQAAKTITPSTSSQTAVASGRYTTGAVTVKGDSNLIAGNIKSGVSIFGVNGNYIGSGGDTSMEDGLVARTLTSYTNNRVKTIGNHAFYNCYGLTTVSFPAVTTIGTEAFCSCGSLTTASFPAATYIGVSAFRSCGSLTTVSFPAVTTIGLSAFCSCNGLTTVSFPAVTTIGNYAFYCCGSLTTASFPAARHIGNYAFRSCSSLTTISFPAAVSIGSTAFSACYNLKSLYLTGSTLCTLSKSDVFTSTPIGGYSSSAGTYGSIYVPASLLASYKAATNWTYFSSRFVGI